MRSISMKGLLYNIRSQIFHRIQSTERETFPAGILLPGLFCHFWSLISIIH